MVSHLVPWLLVSLLPLQRRGDVWSCCWCISLLIGLVSAAPHVEVWQALELKGAPENENFATKNQALNVWSKGSSDPSELVVALVHQWHDIERRADDQQWAVVWESDGETLREVQRLQMSCPDVELVVPNRGPYVYEARLDFTGGNLHPECSCQPSPTNVCLHGVHAVVAGDSAWNLTSVVDSHFVSVQNEWNEFISDPAILGRLQYDLEASIVLVTEPVSNAHEGAPSDANLACPGSNDDVYGSHDVTLEELTRLNMRLPEGHVDGKWCLVRRGGCSETAKAKICELSGAVGVIVVDHANFDADQEITIRYNRAAGERGKALPLIFISKADGERLLAAMTSHGDDVKLRVGPSIGGPAPASYSAGSGIIVHTLGSNMAADRSSTSRAYPDIFASASWVEVSDVRDLLFVCLQNDAKVQIYNVSRPLEGMPLVGQIFTACSRYGLHDYRVLDYLGPDGRYRTLLVDPADNGNRLDYYDTHDPSKPRPVLQVHANWEAENDGLGQVRPGGPDGRYHLVTWHCSDVFCGKNHGDAVYVLDTWNLTAPALQVHLPMSSTGGFARDVACGADGLCIISLTWDGIAVFDSGVADTVNKFQVVTSLTGSAPFSSASIPQSQATLRLYSGAQKTYASKQYPRHFYVEHADFSLRPLQVGDTIRALQLRELWLVRVKDYDASVQLAGALQPTVEPPIQPTAEPSTTVLDHSEENALHLHTASTLVENSVQEKSTEETVPMSLMAALIGVMALLLIFCSVLLFLVIVAWRRNKSKKEALEHAQHNDAGSNSNVVVGRPVDDATEGTQASAGESFAGNVAVEGDESKAKEVV